MCAEVLCRWGRARYDAILFRPSFCTHQPTQAYQPQISQPPPPTHPLYSILVLIFCLALFSNCNIFLYWFCFVSNSLTNSFWETTSWETIFGSTEGKLLLLGQKAENFADYACGERQTDHRFLIACAYMYHKSVFPLLSIIYSALHTLFLSTLWLCLRENLVDSQILMYSSKNDDNLENLEMSKKNVFLLLKIAEERMKKCFEGDAAPFIYWLDCLYCNAFALLCWFIVKILSTNGSLLFAFKCQRLSIENVYLWIILSPLLRVYLKFTVLIFNISGLMELRVGKFFENYWNNNWNWTCI